MLVKTRDKSEKVTTIGKEPVVVFPLKRWEEIEVLIEDMKDALRFNHAISDPKNKKLVPFDEVKKKLKLS